MPSLRNKEGVTTRAIARRIRDEHLFEAQGGNHIYWLFAITINFYDFLRDSLILLVTVSGTCLTRRPS